MNTNHPINDMSMEFCVSRKRCLRTLATIFLAIFVLRMSSLSCVSTSFAATSSHNPTLIVNTEAFNVLDEGDGATNIQIRFGQSLNEQLTFDRSNTRFQFSRGLLVGGNLTATGALSIKKGISGATLRVDGRADVWGTLGVSGSLKTRGNLSGASININNLLNCDTIDTNAAGAFVCGTDSGGGGGMSMTDGDNRYVNASGDSMTGTLTIKNAGALNASGTILTNTDLTLNSDRGAVDATLTFGNATSNQTLQFLHAVQEFGFSKGIRVAGQISGSGNLIVRNALTTPTLKVDVTAGRVGIGTSAPETTFEVVGSMSSSTLTVSGTAGNTFVLDGNSVVFDATNNNLGIRAGTAPHSTLTSSGSFATSQTIMTATGNILATHQIIAASGSSPITLTLPTAIGINGRQYTIKKVDYSLNNFVTIATTSSQTIDGLTSWILHNRGQEITVVSDGKNWNVRDNTTYGYNGYRSMGSVLNQWYTSPNAGTALVSTALTATSSMRLMPFIAEKVMTIDGIGVSVVTTVASSSVRLGIYRDNGNMYPGKLVVDAGTVATTAANAATICPSGCTTTSATLPVTIQPGLYWLVVHHSAHAIGIRGFAIAGVIPLMGFAGALNAASPNMAYILTTAQASLPASFAPGATLVTAAPLPAIFVRIAK